METVRGLLFPLSNPGSLWTRVKEVPSLVSWVYCFVTYMAVQAQDAATRDILAYCLIIIWEALRHGDMGWLDYECSFCSQAAIDPTLQWNTLLPDLQASTVLGH